MEKLSVILSNDNKRQKIGEGIYLLYFAIMAGARAYGLYDGMTTYNILLVISMCLFMCKMVVTRHTFSEYVIAGILLTLSGVVYLNSGEKGLIVCFTMMLGMKGVSVYKTVSVGAVVCGLVIMARIFLGVFGFASEIYYPQERDGVGLMFRHALGYAHPNTLHMNVLMLSMMVIYLVTIVLNAKAKRDGDGKNRPLLVLLVIFSALVLGFNIYVYQYSGSRTGMLGCVVYLAVNMWLFIRKRIGVFEKFLLYISFPFVAFVSIGLPLILKGEVFDLVNRKVFTTRFSLARYFWKNNTLSLLGQRLSNPNEAYSHYGIDMAQLYLFLQLGVVAFVVIAIITMTFIYWSIKNDRRAELSVLMGMLFIGIWEPLLYNLAFKNFVYVFMGAALYEWMAERRSEKYEFANVSVNDIMIEDRLSLKSLFAGISTGIVVGIVAVMIYMAATSVPTALYGDREQGESGNSFGMEALYISDAEMDSIVASGDIVIGYVDATTPMYRYSSEIAAMEYEKRVMSVGVWSGMLVSTVLTVIRIIPGKFRRRVDDQKV